MPGRALLFRGLGVEVRDPTTGKRNVFLVSGNMPGLRNAGRVFGKYYAAFMTKPKPDGPGLTQSVVERRVFYAVADGALQFALGVHVDDNLALVVDKPEYDSFKAKWDVFFKKPDSAPAESVGTMVDTLATRSFNAWPTRRPRARARLSRTALAREAAYARRLGAPP